MSVLYACPRCALAAEPADRFCGRCGLQRPPSPGPLPPAPAAVQHLQVPPRPTPVPAITPAVAPAATSAAFPAVGTTEPAESAPRGAGSVVLSGIALTMRLGNGLLTVLSGITIAVIAVRDPSAPDPGWIVAAGVAWALYGFYILLTRRSYWVSSWLTYLVPIGAIVYLVASSR